MSNYIGYNNHRGTHNSFRLGTNGSGGALLNLFAVAYAASGLPNEKRARRCVRPMRHPEIRMGLISCREQVTELLALSYDDCFWADFDTQQAGTGFFLKPPQCEVYKAILRPIVLWNACPSGTLILPATEVRATAQAWRQMLPILAQCPAQEKVSAMTLLAEEADQHSCNLEIH